MAKGKKSGAFLNQKKKAGSADFSNPKAKVGRKVKRRVGETDASFQTRQLSIGEQSIARQKKDGAKTSKRGLTKRGRRFFAPEDDVLDVDDVAEGDDAIPGHRGVVLLRDVRRARPGDWRRREAAAAATATVADGEAAARVEDAASARRELAGRVAELAADAVRRAEATGARRRRWRSRRGARALCCLARRRPDLFGATRELLAKAAPLRLGDRAASQLAQGVAERADAALLSCAVDAGLAGKAVGPALELLKKHQAGGRGVVRRLLLTGVSGDARRRLLARWRRRRPDPQLLADSRRRRVTWRRASTAATTRRWRAGPGPSRRSSAPAAPRTAAARRRRCAPVAGRTRRCPPRGISSAS
ncbi:hypothetical protein JL722_1220 [Aureococcus anophagefferens]|nr:hypothetical protein JL722_1220 [Aureococcus anophagefferens]